MDKKSGIRSSSLGVGYVSVMIIFAIICLTVFAVLSFRAASSNDSLNVRSGDYLKQYYEADTRAKEILAQLDECAENSRKSGFFEDSFELSAENIPGISLNRAPGGFSAGYSVKINDRQELAATVIFKESGGYEITRWQSRTVSPEDSDSHINVWDGKFDSE